MSRIILVKHLRLMRRRQPRTHLGQENRHVRDMCGSPGAAPWRRPSGPSCLLAGRRVYWRGEEPPGFISLGYLNPSSLKVKMPEKRPKESFNIYVIPLEC